MNSHIAWGIKTTWSEESSYLWHDVFCTRKGAIDHIFSEFLDCIPSKYKKTGTFIFKDALVAKDKRGIAWKWLKRKYNFSIIRVELRELP